MSETAHITLVPLDQIDADTAWNSRSPGSILASVSETDEESTGLDGLIANLLRHGQDTPVDVRQVAVPFYKLTNKPYSLVAGFRRFSAITKINESEELKKGLAPFATLVPGVTDGHIRAVIHPPMTEQAAFLLNARENTNRDQLTPPDVFRLVQKASAFGMTPPDTAVALGKSHSSIASYAKMMSLPPKILEHWTLGGDFDGVRSVKRLAIGDMFELARRKPEEQWEAYKRALVLQTRRSEGTAWWEKAKGRASAMGTLLARLQKSSFLAIQVPSWTNHIDQIVRVGKRELKYSEARELTTLAENAYRRELDKPTPLEETLQDDFPLQ